jgi:hypothetical protein
MDIQGSSATSFVRVEGGSDVKLSNNSLSGMKDKIVTYKAAEN